MLMQLPARLLLEQWPPSSEWRLRAPQGSVWNGEVTGLHYQGRDLGSLRWRFKPWRLLLGEIAADWAWDGPYGEARGTIGRGLIGQRLELHDVHLDVAMAIASDVGWSPLALGGRLDGRLEHISLQAGESAEVAGQLQWHDAALGSSETLSLGRVRIRVDEQVEQGSLILDNEPGDVRLEGKLELLPANQIDLLLTLQSVSKRGETALKLLASVGTATQEGGIQLGYKGPFPPR